jgi:hypothetical protein
MAEQNMGSSAADSGNFPLLILGNVGQKQTLLKGAQLGFRLGATAGGCYGAASRSPELRFTN